MAKILEEGPIRKMLKEGILKRQGIETPDRLPIFIHELTVAKVELQQAEDYARAGDYEMARRHVSSAQTHLAKLL